MNKRKIWHRFGVVLILALALSGCGKGSEGEAVPEEETVEGEDSYAEQQAVVEVIQEELLSEGDDGQGEQLSEADDGQGETAVSQEMSWAVSYAADGKSLSAVSYTHLTLPTN